MDPAVAPSSAQQKHPSHSILRERQNWYIHLCFTRKVISDDKPISSVWPNVRFLMNMPRITKSVLLLLRSNCVPRRANLNTHCTSKVALSEMFEFLRVLIISTGYIASLGIAAPGANRGIIDHISSCIMFEPDEYQQPEASGEVSLFARETQERIGCFWRS